jgi:hypothetical protein
MRQVNRRAVRGHRMNHRLILPLAALVLASAAAEAAPRDDALVGIGRCGALADDRAWLNCVYGAVQPVRGELGLPPAPQARPPLPGAAAVPPPAPRRKEGFLSGVFGSAAKPVPEQQFGLKPAAPPAMPQNVTNLRQRLQSYALDRNGIFTVVLANGQVWQQVTGDTSYAHLSKAAATYVVDIEPGVFGSYTMHIDGQHGGFKVRRLK